MCHLELGIIATLTMELAVGRLKVDGVDLNLHNAMTKNWLAINAHHNQLLK